MRTINLLMLFIAFFAISSCNQSAKNQDFLNSIPNPKTLGETYVSNPDQLLSEQTVNTLNGKLIPLDQSGTAHIDVVMVNTIGDNVPKDFAHQLFRKWKIGDAKKNNGLLILLVKDQRRMEFETGYGLEGALPDITCYQIQQEYMVPRAKEGNYDQAVLDGVDAVIAKLTGNDENGTVQADSNTEELTVPPVAAPNQLLEQDTTTSSDGNIVAPYSDGTITVEEQQPTKATYPRTFDSWTNLIIFFIYVIFAIIISRDITAKRFKIFLNPVFYFLLIVPIGGLIALDIYRPISWMATRQALILYGFLTLFIQLYLLMWNVFAAGALKGLSNHEKYLQRQNAHASIRWSRIIFPVLLLYWRIFDKNQQRLRDTAPSCQHCKNAMIRLDEQQDNHYLTKGQQMEEKIDSVDYDVWNCTNCKSRSVLDYQNPYSKADTCPECNFKTLMFKENRVVQRATTSSSGSGYKLYICKNCNHNKKVAYTIAKISTSSSSSSSGSSSSSSRSSSSGGSSGGGGAGSSW